jgi:hypothetical protein
LTRYEAVGGPDGLDALAKGETGGASADSRHAQADNQDKQLKRIIKMF